MQTALDLRTALLEQGCCYTLDIAAHLPDGTAEFTVDCACAPDGTVVMELVAPDSIAGISATVEPDGEAAKFDDVALDFGLLADGQVAPMALPQLLFACWTGGYIQEAGQEKTQCSAVYLSGYGEKELAIEQWFTPEGIPTGADFWFGTQNFANATIRDFSIGVA